MNAINSLFMVVKKHCNTSGIIEGADRFKYIADEANIPLSKLETYLATLRDLGMLHYNLDQHIIKLTERGKGQSYLFNT